MHDHQKGIPFIPRTETIALLSTDPHVTTLHKITYEELHDLTDRIAFRLTQQFRPKSVIAVYLPESNDYVIAMIAIWKAGMIYFPLNNKSTLNTAQIQKAKAQLLDQAVYTKLSQPAENTFSFKSIELFDTDWAYYIASSGTTSAPKIIRIRFEALMSRIRDHQQRMNIHKKNNDIMLALLNCAFDASIMEMLSALTEGIPLCIAPETIRENVFNLPELFSLAHENGFAITTGIFVPSILKGMSPQRFPGLKSFLATGEAFEKAEQVKTWLDAGIKIFNGYGPTEVTFGVSIVEITDPEYIPLFFEGSIQNSGIFSGLVCFCLKKSDETPYAKWTLWDTQDNEGEVFLTGQEGLGEYLDDPERNEKKFIPREKYAEYFDVTVIDKIQHYPRIYQVNDIVKRVENRFVFVRRSDRMIKRAGKQVDLEEIETRFKKQFPGLDITVMYHKKLIRAFINSSTIPLVSRLEGEKPNVYYHLNKEKFEQETQSNSKLKKTFETLEPFSQKIFPVKENFSSTEQKVAELWQRLFEEDITISLDTDFTEELGGESLLRMQMTNKIWNTLLDKNIREQSASTVEFSRYLNKNKTIRKIAKLVDACNSTYLDCTEEGVFNFKQPISSDTDDDAIIVSAILQIRRHQKIGPYILFCSNPDHLNLYEKLKAQLEVSTPEIYLTTELSELEHYKNERTRKRLLNKLTKTQQIVLEEKLPALNFIDIGVSASVLLTGSAFSGKTSLLKRFTQLHWSNFSNDNKDLAIYLSLKNAKTTAICDWLTQWLQPDEIAFLQKNYMITFLLDDYDLLARNDFPDIRLSSSEWPHVNYIIASRREHLDIPESREAFQGFQEITLPDRNVTFPPEYENSRSRKTLPGSTTPPAEQKYDLPQDAEKTLVPLVEGHLAKPIFAFAPITGDVTEYYRKLSSQLGFQQPFYVFILPEEGPGRSQDLNERAAYYASIIQAKYPHGEMILLGWSFGAIQAYATAKILQQQNRIINTIINIDSAWPKDLSGFNVTQQLEKMKPRLEEIYAKNPEGLDSGIENTKCNLEAYFHFIQQELEHSQRFSIPLIVYKAEKTDTGLTDNPEFVWPCEGVKIIEISNSDHFTIFKQSEFITAIQSEINKLQPVASDIPLQQRLADYREKKLNASGHISEIEKFQLYVSRYPIPQTVPLLASEILNTEDQYKTIVLCGEPGSGKSTTLKSLEVIALKQKPVPVFIKLKEYSSPTAITEKLLQIGLTLQEIATAACTNLIFFLDGFDELDNKTTLLEISHLLKPLGRIVISTRTHVYEKLNIKSTHFFGSHLRYDLNALTENQIKLFLNNEKDFEFISQYPELLALCKNPLTLSLIKKILPEIQEAGYLNARFTRYEIYRRFIKKLYTEKEMLVRKEHGIRPQFDIQYAFEYLNREHSMVAWKLKEKPEINSLMKQHYVNQADVTENHETFIEYFIANSVFEEILSKNFCALSKINFTQKTSFVDFLCERIQNQPLEYYIKFIHILMIELQTNTDPQTSSNLGTLLTKLEVPFSNLFLRKINFSGADLSGGIFYGTDFKGAHFQEANVSYANFSHSNCENTNFYKTNFGQYPSVTFDTIYITAAMLLERGPDEPLLCAIAYKNHKGTTQIDIRGTHEGKHVEKLFSVFTKEKGDINRLIISPKNLIGYVKNRNELFVGEADLSSIQKSVKESLSEDGLTLTSPKEIIFSGIKIYPYNNDKTPIVELNLNENDDIGFYTHRGCYAYDASSKNLKKIKSINHPTRNKYKLFCISSDLTKIAYAVIEDSDDKEVKKYKCMVYNINSRECLFESDYTEEILELFFTKKNGFLCLRFDSTENMYGEEINRIVFLDLTSKNVVYHINRLSNVCHTYVSNDMSILLAISYDEKEYRYACATMPETTFEFELLPREFNKPVFERKIDPKQTIARPKLHPQLPIIIYCPAPQQIQLQYLSSKNIFYRLNLPFKIICVEAYEENIYILGSRQLSVWRYENHTLLNIFSYTFDDHSWYRNEIDDFVSLSESSPTFVFLSKQCFTIFNSAHAFYFNNSKVFMKKFKLNIHWIHFLDMEKLLVGLSSDERLSYLGMDEECESELVAIEWNPVNNSRRKRLYISDHCEKSNSPSREFKLVGLNNDTDTLTVLGGGGRTVYRYRNEKDYENIGRLPGWNVLQIAPDLFASIDEDNEFREPYVVVKFFRLLGENEENEFRDAPVQALSENEDNDFSDSSEDTASDESSSGFGPLIKKINELTTSFEDLDHDSNDTLTWQPLLQLLMMDGDQGIQIWHIDIQNNCSSTLVYHSKNHLNLKYINTAHIKVDALNKKMLEDAGLDHEIHLSNCEEYGVEIPEPKQFERSLKLLDTLTEEDKCLSLSTINGWLAIFNQISYTDRLAFSAVSKKYYAIANHIEINKHLGLILSSNDIFIVEKIVSAYIKQLLINLMSFPLDQTTPLEIKPSRVAPHLLTIGFFSGGKKHSWDYPVKLLEKTSYFP